MCSSIASRYASLSESLIGQFDLVKVFTAEASSALYNRTLVSFNVLLINSFVSITCVGFVELTLDPDGCKLEYMFTIR